ncbi:MAG: alpha/beta fold hydrolase [Lachnospiraceae bacterium]|nr:alpha/beta fold hydrolase [Lachnospiraceae bacterium]
MIRRKEYTHVSGSDGLELSVLRIEPEDTEDIKGVLQLVHGMSEHKGRYEPFMNYMAERGYICVIHDNRGHGGSVKDPSDLGYMYEGGYEALIEDIHEITLETKEYAAELCPGERLPFTLLGHSMGSLAVRCYIRRYDDEPDKLCVLGCPSEMKGMTAGLALVNLLISLEGDKAHSKLVDHIIFSGYNKRYKDEGIPNAWVNSGRREVEEYNADPLCGFGFTLNGYRNLVLLTKLCYKKDGFAMNKPELPIRFFSGGEDPCAISRGDIGNAVRLLKHAGYRDVKARMYPGMRHEILNEKKKAWVYKDIYDFIEGKE